MKLNHAPLLIVEDDPNDVVLVRRAFHRAQIDVEVVVVPGIDQARAYLSGQGVYADRAEHPLPMLVLLDLKLPGGSGLELCQWIRQHPDLACLPIVAFTSSRNAADVREAYAAGCNSYLVKPVAYDALQKLLTSFGHYWFNFNLLPEMPSGPRVAARRPS